MVNAMDTPGRPTNQLTASQYLRFSTRYLHESLESQIDWSAALSNLAGYCRLLARIQSVQRPVDNALDALLPKAPDQPHERRNAAWLDRDLAWATAQPDGPDKVPQREPVDVSWIGTPAEAAGVAYVFEGSTLGAAVLAKQARDNLGASPDAGCEYLSAYGSQTVPRWRQTQQWLDRSLATEADTAAAAAAAQRAFLAYAQAIGGQS
ncbi:Heme oxygenase [Posidoniimonas polymericola]|uniref:Heme oxygenase n=1 Tax=Posidoniimonas polymericola TaxID=2528002 RepID=A0A5C5YSV1_9BACT|nr:biliverdin-producing heme oxygenase [Posidoniimonas polymericola]TWT78039.1 Heme oxygenase [Posidoniimonas polymericola]